MYNNSSFSQPVGLALVKLLGSTRTQSSCTCRRLPAPGRTTQLWSDSGLSKWRGKEGTTVMLQSSSAMVAPPAHKL